MYNTDPIEARQAKQDKATKIWNTRVGITNNGFKIVSFAGFTEKGDAIGVVKCIHCHGLFNRLLSPIINKTIFGCKSCTAFRRESIKKGLKNNYDI